MAIGYGRLLTRPLSTYRSGAEASYPKIAPREARDEVVGADDPDDPQPARARASTTAIADEPSGRVTPTPCQQSAALRQVPHLRRGAVAVPDPERRPVRRAPAGVVDALAAVADDRPGDLPAVAGADDRRRVAVEAGGHVLREPEVLALCPHQRGCTSRRPQVAVARDVRAVPDLFRHE